MEKEHLIMYLFEGLHDIYHRNSVMCNYLPCENALDMIKSRIVEYDDGTTLRFIAWVAEE